MSFEKSGSELMEKLLDVENVSISFIQYTKGLNQRDLKVITDLTLDISEGEILAVLGSSGSGKSLLAHAIFGILPENANLNGKIKYKGKELTQESKEELRGKEITLIPQSVNFLDPLMKISDIAIGHCDSDEERKAKKIKQREIFEHYNLGPEVDDMYPFQLSGGMARRVLVSTALLSDPKLVVADEPTPGLDEKTVQEIIAVPVQVEEEDPEENVVFQVVENMPEFPGGRKALMEYLAENIKYPSIAAENNIQGRVVCQFTVWKDGTIKDIVVARGIDPSLDREAIRVVQSMPKWTPGKQRGKAVNCRFTLPILFRLQ